MIGGEGDPLGIVQEIEIWQYYQMVHTQTRIIAAEWDALDSLGFWDIKKWPNPDQKTRPRDN